MSWLAGIGWLAACLVTAMWMLAWRALGSLMEAVARTCHELRGPLTAAQLGLELGSRRGALARDQIRAIHSELGRAAVALDDLAASRRDRGMSQRLDVATLLADSVTAWRPVAERAGVALELQVAAGLPSVQADPRRLSQVTGNLIANAIEHGQGVVRVRASRRADRIRIDVLDDGPGLQVPLGELVGRARRGHGERGRGLVIATTAASTQGGRVTAEPAARGTHVVVELPAGT